jgi:hypothetical protein
MYVGEQKLRRRKNPLRRKKKKKKKMKERSLKWVDEKLQLNCIFRSMLVCTSLDFWHVSVCLMGAFKF